MNYDLAIVYRIYPLVSKVPPVFSDDKYKLSRLCLESFKRGLNGVKFKLYVLIDNCPIKYKQLFEEVFSDGNLEIIELPQSGNAKTFQMQIDLLKKQNDSEYIYFAEDDYFYFPGAIKEMLVLLNERPDIDFVSPYDHMDSYTLTFHDYNSRIIFHGNRHWRDTSSTCLTFMTRKRVLIEAENIFSTYTFNNFDASIWISLTKKGIFKHSLSLKSIKTRLIIKIIGKAWQFCWKQIIFGRKFKLFTPIPSISTHMDNQCLAPGFVWLDEFKDDLK